MIPFVLLSSAAFADNRPYCANEQRLSLIANRGEVIDGVTHYELPERATHVVREPNDSIYPWHIKSGTGTGCLVLGDLDLLRAVMDPFVGIVVSVNGHAHMTYHNPYTDPSLTVDRVLDHPTREFLYRWEVDAGPGTTIFTGRADEIAISGLLPGDWVEITILRHDKGDDGECTVHRPEPKTPGGHGRPGDVYVCTQTTEYRLYERRRYDFVPPEEN